MGQPALPERQTTGNAPVGEQSVDPATREALAPGRAAFLASFGYAWQGIVYVVRSQRNMRIHLAAGTLVLALAILLRLSPLDVAVLLVCIIAVVVLEMLNTVVEAVVDLRTDRYHPLAKIAKDVAAGAVLVAAAGSAVIGLLVLGPPLWHALFR